MVDSSTNVKTTCAELGRKINMAMETKELHTILITISVFDN